MKKLSKTVGERNRLLSGRSLADYGYTGEGNSNIISREIENDEMCTQIATSTVSHEQSPQEESTDKRWNNVVK